MSLTLDLDIPPSTVFLNNLGAVYTPDMLAHWAAELLVRYAPDTIPLQVIDPACGEGALLQSVSRLMGSQALLTGVEIDENARKIFSVKVPSATAHHQNALLLLKCPFDHSLSNKGAYDAVIMNPPWGANTGFGPSQLKGMGYTLANGQFDTYELFVELALHLLKAEGLVVAIIPDSLFLHGAPLCHEHPPAGTGPDERSDLCGGVPQTGRADADGRRPQPGAAYQLCLSTLCGPVCHSRRAKGADRTAERPTDCVPQRPEDSGKAAWGGGSEAQ